MAVLIQRALDLSCGPRRESFVWAHAWRRGFSLVADLSAWPDQCAWVMGQHRRFPIVISGAVQDTAGLWHLVGSTRCCTTSMARAHRRRVIDKTADAGSIPARLRCPQGRAVWPGNTGTEARYRAYRLDAIAALGQSCSICRSRPGQVIDHDHITGRTRGYVDRECNLFVDRCRHLDDCAFASYMESPRSDLGVFPEHSRLMRQPKYRARWLVFEIVMSGGTSPGAGVVTVEDLHGWALPVPDGLPDPIPHS